ncbi:MAG: ABC transporter substrate-binding protein [Chloroflexota bacterium]
MKNFVKTMLLLSFLGGLLSGCSGAQQPAVVTFAVFGEPAELAAYESLVATFEARHAQIDVQIRHTPSQGEYRRRLATEFSSGQPSNVVLLNYRHMAAFAADGGLEALTPFLEKSKTIRESDFYPTAIEAFYYQDQLYCIPQNLSNLVVYYNKDLFDAAGLAYPSEHWTWDDFVAAGRALTQGDQYGIGVEPSLMRLAPFIWQNGADLVDNPTNPTRLTLDNPQAREAFQWFVDLQVKERIVPDANLEAAEESQARFLNGRLGMYLDSRKVVPALRTITAFDWDVAWLPQRVEAASILHSDGYCMSAATENKDAAWAFIEFANSAAGQEIIAPSGRTVPSIVKVAESPTFLVSDFPPAHNQVYLDAAPYLRVFPVIRTWPGIESAVNAEIERAFYGNATVDEAIAAASAAAQPFFDEIK